MTFRAATLLILLSIGISAFAESGLSGRVLDPQGNAVPGAAVRLESGSGYRANATSDREGRYSIGPVPDGEYRLKAESPGLSSIDQSVGSMASAQMR